jgi:transposase-like protein
VTDTNVFQLVQPGTFADSLTEVLRNGARALLARAVEAEVAGFLAEHADKHTDEGRRRLVRHGHLPERSVMTGIGAVAVSVPRVRDRLGSADDRIRFTSAILPPYARRSKSLEVLLPVLYLKGVSTGDFAEALSALLGPDAGGLSASTIARLKEAWVDEHARWRERDLSAKRYVYFWADGIYVQARLEDEAKALEEVWPKTRAQRCWVHKTANVLNQLPSSLQTKAKRAVQDIWMAETRTAAEAAFDGFIETYGVKYEKAVACLAKDREALLAFYDFPAEHWAHLRTTNPIESTFATVRHRTIRSKGCLSNKTALAMIFKLAQAAENSWRRLKGHAQLPKVICGVKFKDGIEDVRSQAQAAAA